MKLIKLELTPDGNSNNEVIEVIIDHNPDIFKSTYVRVVRMLDGSLNMTDHPANITKQERDKAFRYALAIIDMVYDITCGF